MDTTTQRPAAAPASAAAPDAEALRRRIAATPIDELDPSDPDLFETDTVEHAFARLRREDPVHRSRSPHFGEFWSVTRYQDIMAVDTNHQAFSSDWSRGGITLLDMPVNSRLRVRIELMEATPIEGSMQMAWKCTIEPEGEAKPVCVAESLSRSYL